MINEPVNQRHMSDNPGASARMATQSRPPELAAKTAERTSLGHRFQRALAGGPNRRFPGLHPSPGGATSLSPFLNKRLALPILAILALLAASLLFLLPGGPLHAQDASIIYEETGIHPVATYTGTDPEGRMVYWSLSPTADVDLNNDDDTSDPGEVDASPDSDHFMISSDGVLRFKFSPDYEMPRGLAIADDNTNTYKVVVVASDDAPGAGGMINMGYKSVTVMVTDKDEPGMVTLSAQQPQIGVELTAILTDDDAEDADENAVGKQIGAKWKWEHSDSKNGPWTAILPATSATYTPLGVADKYLRVMATYTDGHGSDKSEMVVSANMVRAIPAANNAPPTFLDEDPDTNDTQVGRKVDENSPPGTRVGNPVVANDTPGDVLTYTLTEGQGNDNYRINQATGQITVGPRTMLDREDDTLTDFTHTVTVTATDPAGEDADQPVTITINDVNEAPMMTGGTTRITSHAENTAIAEVVGNYPATDPESAAANGACDMDNCTWSVSGADSGDFEISNEGALTFKEVPNYEMPADATRDNIYMVTVVVTDNDAKKKLTAMRDVTVTVTNMEEEGTVTLSTVQPKIGIELTAMLDDPDGVVADSVKWTWHTIDTEDAADATDANAIEMATSDTYTPDEIGDLSAKASYTDGEGANKSAIGSSTAGVIVNNANVAPEFPDTETGMREVDENTVAGEDIGALVEATDANEPTNNPVLTYTLSGTDAASFDIDRSDGQLATKAKLDYETKKSYMVTVTATDSDGLDASIAVTIKVTNVDEAPMIAGEDIAEDFRENGRNLVIERFRATDPEGRMVYWSLAPDGTDFSEVDGVVNGDEADVDHFMISSDGVLSFKFSPDYEMPREEAIDADDNTNTYKVVVVASDDAPGAGDMINMGYKSVTVMVTDVEETETVTLSAELAQVGVLLTATYNDLDNEKPDAAQFTWKWYLGSSPIPEAGDGDIGPMSTYTPVPGDTGTLRAEASYTKTDGSEKAVSKTVRVRAVPDDANADPLFPSGSTARSVDENSPPGTRVGNPVAADDASGDVLTYTLGGDGATSFDIDQARGQITVGARTMLDAETVASYSVTVTATDPAGADADQTVTITINDVNEAPMMDGGFTRNSQSEYDSDDATGDTGINAAKVVATYGATDPESAAANGACDMDNCTWSVSGADSGDFEISNEGALTFKEAPNFEMPADSNRDNVYMVRVVVTDNDAKKKLTAMRDVTVTVTNVDENGTVTLSTEQPKIGIELTAMLDDPDGVVADSVKWTWHTIDTEDAADATDANAIEMATSDTYTPMAVGDLSAKASYTDGEGANKSAIGSSTAGVIVNNANVAPEFPDTETGMREVEENTVAGEDIGAAVAATDANEPNDPALTYTLSGTDEASFDIVRETGQLQTKAKLDYETKKSYMVTVTATDSDGLDASIGVTIKVTNVDEAPMITKKDALTNQDPTFPGAATTRTVDENTVAGEDIGSPVEATDANEDDALTYTLSRTDAASFDIDDTTGQLMTKAALDHETRDSYTVTVTATDEAGLSDAITVTINVGDVEENPEFPGAATTRSVDENTVAGEDIGAPVEATDADEDDALTYTLSGTDAASFDIDDTTGQLMTKAALDYETRDSYTVIVTATDEAGLSDAITVTINVTDVDENLPPEFPGAATTRSVDENTVAGEDIGAPVEATDADEDDALTYVLSGTDAASFDIDDTTGQLMTKAALDYETRDSYTVIVTATDEAGLSDAITVTINVADVDENLPPEFPGAATARSVDENTVAGEDIGAPVEATDADNDALTYVLSGTDAASFDIDDTTGQLMTKAALDYETRDSYTVTVTATDEEGLSDAITVTIDVTDVDDNLPPEFPDAATTRSVDENTVAGEDIGAPVEATDADEDDALTYTLSGTDAASFDIDDTTGQLMTKAALDYETKDSYTVTVTATDEEGLSDAITVTIDVADVDDNLPPEFPDAATTRSVDENTVAGEDIGAPVEATDADNDALTYVLSGTDAASFDIDDTTGQLMTKAALDYETRDSYTVIVTATDEAGLSDAITVTINVTDVDDNLPPEFPGTATARSVAENAVAGEDIGAPVEATDADEDDALTYTLSGTDAASFDIDDTTGQLMTKAALDYETRDSYTVIVTATDEAGRSDAITVTITVTDVDDNLPPEFPDAATTRSVDENTVAGEDIGAPVEATDADEDDALTYVLSGTDAASFDIDDTTGQLQTKAALDYETKDSYTVIVTATDEAGLSDDITVIITVTDVDDNLPPEFPGVATTRSVDENTVAGEDIGAPVEATDADNDALTYVLSGTDAASFDIDDTTGQLMTKAALDYETKDSYTVTVTATDEMGLSDSINVTITVTDVDDVVTGETLLDRYDADKDGWIQLAEARVAVGDHFAPPRGEKLSLADTRKVVGLLFEYLNRQ